MKFDILRPPRHVRREQMRRALREWHEKFAWLPTRVDETQTGSSVVWFEKYWRLGRYGPTNPRSKGDGLFFERYSEKEYFKKQLRGDFAKSESDVQEGSRGTASNIMNTSFTPSYTKLIHDSTDMKISTAVEKIKQQAMHRKHNQ